MLCSLGLEFKTFTTIVFTGCTAIINREVKLEVYGKRQTAKIKFFPSVFSSLYSRIKISVFAVNGKRHFSIYV